MFSLNIGVILRKHYLGAAVSALGLDLIAIELRGNCEVILGVFVLVLRGMSLYGFYASDDLGWELAQ